MKTILAATTTEEEKERESEIKHEGLFSKGQTDTVSKFAIKIQFLKMNRIFSYKYFTQNSVQQELYIIMSQSLQQESYNQTFLTESVTVP